MDFYTAEELAAMWKCDKKTVYGLVARKELAAIRVGRLVRVPKAAAEAFVSGGGSRE